MKAFKIETGAEMYFVDLAITSYINLLRRFDIPTPAITEASLLRTKKRMENCMVNDWGMTLGKGLQLRERNTVETAENQEEKERT